MFYNPRIKNRRSIRLKGYDYSQPGWYFVTIIVKNHDYLFGKVEMGVMVLNKYGKIAHDEWQKTVNIRQHVELDRYIIMPNHVHGIIRITGENKNTEKKELGAYNNPSPLQSVKHNANQSSQSGFQSPSKTIGAIVRGYKSAVTHQINSMCNTPGMARWQRNYWEHIIRNEQELNRIRQYIYNNPANWSLDQNNSI